MNRIVFSFVVVAVLGLKPAAAAPENSHCVDFPKGDAAWSVNLEDLSSKAAPTKSKSDARKITKIEIVRMGNLRRDTVIWSDGAHAECWWTQEPPFAFQEEENKHVTVKKAGNMGGLRFDDTIFGWVDKTTFVKMQTYDGKKCRFYKKEISLFENEKQILRAWIDEKTMKPVAWSDSDIVAVFSFDVPLPSEPLILPAAFQKEIDRLGNFFAPATKPGSP